MSAEEFDRIVAQVGGIDLYLSAVRSWSLVILTSLALAIEPLRVVEAEGDPTLRVMLLDKEYQRLLFDAAESRSFELTRQYIIRKLSDNPALHELPAEPPKQPDLSPGLRLSFRRTYVGAAVDGLYNYLVKCDAEFREPGSNFYGRFLSIVQSSGTGKSRTISRLMQTRALGLYMNIRPVEDTNSYPGRDKIPAAILAGNLECTPEEYANRCVSFFTSIFTAIREELIEEGDGAVSEGTVMKWSREMSCMESPRRGRFFKRVKEKYDQMMANFQKDDGSAPIGTEGRDDKSSKEVTNFQVQAHDAELLKVITGGMESLESGLVDLSIDNGKTARSTSRVQPAPKMGKSSSEESDVIAIPELRGEPLMLVAYEELIAVAPEFFDEASSTPKLVIAIDEAHKLGKQLGGYTPSHILCRVISRFTKSNDTANWVIFASTLAKVADFSAPAHMHPSSRIRRGGEALFAPYSQLDWDQLATPLKEIKLQEVAQLGNIVGFGRPLWKTLLTSDPSMTNLLKTAGWKLCHNTHFDPSDSAQVFAVLGQRFCLDICFGHTKAVELQSKAVSSHLRFCLRTTPDRLWQTTSYPSEPILSCAAARFLFWTSTGHMGANLVQSLQSLWMDIEGGVVDIGKKGELVSRLVYLLAKDIFVRGPGFPAAPKNSRSTNNELLDCRMVPVVDYLEFVFGPSAAAEDVKNVFRGWYINFSHWVSMSAVIKTDDSTGLKTWLTRHWIRTCAIQCCHNQRGIDKLIPMYKKPNSGDPYDGRMSYILISDRARKTSSKRDLEEVSPDGAGIHDLHQPYIAILADLRRNGSKPEFELDAANPTPSLRAYAPGVNPTTYPFLADYGLHKAQETLRMMLDPPQGNSEPGMALLENHAKYGETMDASTLEWEVGREERS